MPTAFFEAGHAKCPLYLKTRDSDETPYPRARAFIEDLWTECGAFLDANLRHHAKQDLTSVAWELYLAHALRRSGVRIEAQQRGKKTQRGPDLLSADPPVSIEAVTLTSGSGDNAIPVYLPCVAYQVPTTEYVLRLRSVIEAKAKVIADYIRDRIIPTDRCTIIAISGSMLHYQFTELPVPRIVRAALGLGDLILNLDRVTGATMSQDVEERVLIYNAKGAPVKTDVFLDAAYAHISGIVYSYADCFNRPFEPGDEFILVHNPTASAPLPRGWIAAGDEYWLEDRVLVRRSHPKRHQVES